MRRGSDLRPRFCSVVSGNPEINKFEVIWGADYYRLRKSKIANRRCGCSSMAERQLPKLHTGVRFPSPAHFKGKLRCQTPSGHNRLVTTCDPRLRRCWQCDRNARSPAGVCRLVDSNVASEKGAAGGIAVT